MSLSVDSLLFVPGLCSRDCCLRFGHGCLRLGSYGDVSAVFELSSVGLNGLLRAAVNDKWEFASFG